MNDSAPRQGKSRRVHIDDDTYEYEPASLIYGIGSGRVLRTAGWEAEKVAAAILLSGLRDSPLAALFGQLDVDGLIETCQRLVECGAITENGMANLPAFPEFN